jgi:adenosine deaminase
VRHRELGRSRPDLRQLARNSFEGSFLSPADKARWINAVDSYAVTGV